MISTWYCLKEFDPLNILEYFNNSKFSDNLNFKVMEYKEKCSTQNNTNTNSNTKSIILSNSEG